MPRINKIVHIEWRSKDLKKLQAFYQACFDWKFKPWNDYVGIDTGSKEGGAGMMTTPPNVPPGLTPYIFVKDLDAAEAKVRAAGAQIMMSKQDVPTMGTFSVFMDPDGNALGLWQPAPKPKARAKAKGKTKKAVKPAAKAKAKATPPKAAKKAAKPKAKKAKAKKK